MTMILVTVLVVVNDGNNFKMICKQVDISYMYHKRNEGSNLKSSHILKIITKKFTFYKLEVWSKEYENWFGVN